MSKDKFSTGEIYTFILLALALIGLRLLHFGDHIDDPHSWRQCDTANYIQDFYENGVDLLHPKVCWMGNHETLILEFPLPEAFIAWAYHLIGDELWVARLVFLLFFLGSAFFLGKIIQHLFSTRIAAYSCLIYLALPISLFYSRAILVDFSTLFFGFAGIFFLLKGIDHQKWKDWLLASLFLSVATLIKAPALFALGLPVAFILIRSPHFRSLLKFLPLLLLPLLAFYFWRNHVEAINGSAPDWSFIPGYFPLVDMGGWYFGNWAQRTDAYNWQVLLERMSLELAGISGLLLMVGGWFISSKQKRFVWLWLIGLIFYFLIFFGLNLIHNYYQIPFLPFIALSAALLLDRLHSRWGMALTLGLLLLFMGENILRSEYTTYPHSDTYYKLNDLYIPAGKYVEEATLPTDYLVLAGPHQDPRSPFFLYRAHRKGWPVNIQSLTPEIIQRLQAEGATQLVLLFNTSPPTPLADFMGEREKKIFHIDRADGSHWTVWISAL